MDKYTWGFLLTVIFNFSAMIAILIIFCAFKKYRSNPNQESKYEIYLNENSFPLKALLIKIYSTPLSEIRDHCGEEAYHYLSLTKILAIFITLMCPLTVVILIPIYHKGNNFTSPVFQISMANIIDNENYLIAPFLMFLLFIIGSYIILRLFIKETLSSSTVNSINSSFIRIMGLPLNLTEEQVKKELAFNAEIEEEAIYSVPALSKAIKFEKLLQGAKDELLHYLDVEKFYNKRELIRVKHFSREKVDAIEYWEQQVKTFTLKLEQEYDSSVKTNSGVCIVKIGPKCKAKDLQMRIRQKFPMSYATSMVLSNDLNWKHISKDEARARVSHICSTLLFFSIFLIIFTPTAFLNYAFTLLMDIGIPSAVIGLLGVFLPDVLLIVYQLLLVPKAVEHLVKHEKHYSKSAEIISALRKFILFFLFNMLFIPAIGLSVVNIVHLAFGSSFNDFSEEIATRMSKSSFFLVSVILTQAFIANPFDLTELGKVIENKYKAIRSVSERETYNAYLPFLFEFPLEYSKLITCFAIILAFSISYPLILIFGSVYLWTRFYVHKYNLMFFFTCKFPKSHVSTIAAKSLLIVLVFFQWFTCFLFILSKFTQYVVLSSFIIFIALMSLPAIWMKYNHMREIQIKEKSETLMNESYVHPLESARNYFLKTRSLQMPE